MTIENFIRDYGYWAVLIGAMIEGESLILTASALAAMGYLSISMVGLVTFFGTLIADQGIFFLGCAYGPKSLDHLRQKVTFLRPHIDKALSFLKRHETVYILVFRFIYGIRIISPFIIGSQGIKFKRFALFNLIAAVIWTILSCLLGYFIGTLGKSFGYTTENIGKIIFVLLVGIFVASALINRLWIYGKKKWQKKKQKSIETGIDKKKNHLGHDQKDRRSS